MKFNRNLTIYSIILIVFCFILVSQVSATDFNGTSLSDLDNSIKTSDDGIVVLNDDLNYKDNGVINIDREITIDGNGHSINIPSSQDDVLFNINGNLVLKNLILSGGKLPNKEGGDYGFINVNSGSKLILNNVTFVGTDLGNTLSSHMVLNSGDVVVANSTITNIRSDYSSFFGNVNSASTLVFENSTVTDSSLALASGFGPFDIENSVFTNIGLKMHGYLFKEIQGELNINSSLFMNIGNSNGLYSRYVDYFVGSICNNVFLGFSGMLFNFDDFGDNFDLKNNYFGSNTPVEDGLLPNSTSFNMDDNIGLSITLLEGDADNLTLGNKVPVEFKLVGDTELLPVFTVNYINSINNGILYQDSMTFSKSSPNIIQFTPRKAGNGSIVLGNDLGKAISPGFDYTATGELKNYSLILNVPESITYGDDLNIGFELKDADSNPISGIVSLFVNGEYFDNITVTDGAGSAVLSNLNSSTINLNAIFYHKLDDYDDVEVNKTVNVAKKNLDFKYDDVKITEGETAVITVTNVPDDFESSVYIGYSTMGGYVYPDNGCLKQSFSNLNPGTYTISIFYAGDTRYNPFNDIALIYVASKGSDSGPDTPDGKPSGGGDTPDVPDVPDRDVPVNPVVPDVPDVPDRDVPVNPVVPDVPDVPKPSDNTPDVTPSDNHGSSDNNNVNPNHGNNNNNANSDTGSHSSTNTHQSNDTASGNLNNMASSSENSQSSSDKSTQDASKSQSGDSGESLDVSKAYGVDKVLDDVMNNKFSFPAILMAIIAIVLLFIGYRSKKDDDEDEY